MLKIVSLNIIWIFILVSCGPNYSSDQLVEEPTQIDDANTLLSYLNNKERSNRDNPSYYYHRANVRFQTGLIKEAVDDIEKAIKLNDEQAGYYELKARLMMERDSYSRALSAALKAQELGSRGPQTYIAMANAWAALKNYPRALEAVETALSLLPLDVDLYYLKAKIFGQQGKQVEANSVLLQVLDINPEFYPAMYDLVEYSIANQDIDAAYFYINKLKNIPGQGDKADLTYSRLLYSQGKYDSAALMINRLSGNPLYRTRVYQLLGNIKFSTYQYDSSIYFARRLLELDSLNRNAFLLNARAFERKRFYQKSRENYEKLLAMDSTDQLVREELAKLDRKVAYLRKLEQERSQRPQLIPLKPRDIKN